MYLSKWLHGIEPQRLNVELLDAQLTSDRYGRFEGQGFLRWNRRKGFRIDLLTDGGHRLATQNFSTAPPKVGGLVPWDAYLKLNAADRLGYTLEVERLSVLASSVVMGQEPAVWRFDKRHIYSAVDIRRGRSIEAMSFIQLLLSNGHRLPWPRRSPMNKPCLQAVTSLGTLIAHGRPCGDIAVTIELNAPHNPGRIVEAVGAAFSFWAGRIIPVIAYEASEGDAKWMRILSRLSRPSPASLAPPLGVVPSVTLEPHQETLLANAFDFFAKDEGQATRSLVLASLSCRHAPFSPEVLVSCSALEGLANLAAKSQRSHEVISNEQKTIVDTSLAQSGFSNDLIERFRGFMGILNSPSASNLLGRMCVEGAFGLDRSDWDAWKSRNKLAHGNLSLLGATFEERDRAVSDHDRIRNMINKLVMAAIGYEGTYLDYATYQETQFPPTSGTPASQ
jgi:hypothetical protein